MFKISIHNKIEIIKTFTRVANQAKVDSEPL